jgi:hypothetical protein
MPIGLAMAGASLVGGYMQGEAAKDAANTNLAGTLEGIRAQKEMFNTTNEQQAAGRGMGYQGYNQIRSMLPGQYTQYDENGKPIGTATGTDYLTHQFNAQDFQNNLDPGYAFRLQQGQLANQAALNKGGGLIGGNVLTGMNDYNQGMASQEYNNTFNRYQTQRSNIYNTLASIAGLGQAAQAQTNVAAQNFANNQTGLITAGAASQAAGTVGAANAISGGLNNAASMYAFNDYMKRPPTTPPPRSSQPVATGNFDFGFDLA